MRSRLPSRCPRVRDSGSHPERSTSVVARASCAVTMYTCLYQVGIAIQWYPSAACPLATPSSLLHLAQSPCPNVHTLRIVYVTPTLHRPFPIAQRIPHQHQDAASHFLRFAVPNLLVCGIGLVRLVRGLVQRRTPLGRRGRHGELVAAVQRWSRRVRNLARVTRDRQVFQTRGRPKRKGEPHTAGLTSSRRSRSMAPGSSGARHPGSGSGLRTATSRRRRPCGGRVVGPVRWLGGQRREARRERRGVLRRVQRRGEGTAQKQSRTQLVLQTPHEPDFDPHHHPILQPQRRCSGARRPRTGHAGRTSVIRRISVGRVRAIGRVRVVLVPTGLRGIRVRHGVGVVHGLRGVVVRVIVQVGRRVHLVRLGRRVELSISPERSEGDNPSSEDQGRKELRSVTVKRAARLPSTYPGLLIRVFLERDRSGRRRRPRLKHAGPVLGPL